MKRAKRAVIVYRYKSANSLFMENEDLKGDLRTVMYGKLIYFVFEDDGRWYVFETGQYLCDVGDEEEIID